MFSILLLYSQSLTESCYWSLDLHYNACCINRILCSLYRVADMRCDVRIRCSHGIYPALESVYGLSLFYGFCSMGSMGFLVLTLPVPLV